MQLRRENADALIPGSITDAELRSIERALVAGIAPDRQSAAMHRMLAALTAADLIALRRALDCSDDAGVFLALRCERARAMRFESDPASERVA